MLLGRRDFLRIGAAAAAAMATLGGAPIPVENRNGMPYRLLGKTGEKVSILGVGGFHIGMPYVSEEESIRIQRMAIDEGVNFFDNAYIYNDGRSEELMGKALRDGYRDKVFLMTKTYTHERDLDSAKKQLDESLQRLGTDHLDLWQVHQVHEREHARQIHENGIPEFMLQAKKEGKIRYLGFTGHSRPEYLKDVLAYGFPWDTIQMPLNAFDHHWLSFETGVLPTVVERGMGIIGMKALGGSPAPFITSAKALTVAECLRYSLNLPVSVLVSGMDSVDKMLENVKIAKAFTPLSTDEVSATLAKCMELAQGGIHEYYKIKEI